MNPLWIPVKLAGLLAAGVALGAGWRLGGFLGDLATGDRTVDLSTLKGFFDAKPDAEPLWKRKFGPVS